MKPKTIFYVIVAVVAATMIALMIYSGVAYNKIIDLEKDKSVSEGKVMVYGMVIDQLKAGLEGSQENFNDLKKQSDYDKYLYNKKVKERDKEIAQYKKEREKIAGLTSSEAIIYFDERTKSDKPSDTSFIVPSANIKTANTMFVERDEAISQVDGLKQSEQALLKLNSDLVLQVENRQTYIDRMNKMLEAKDSQSDEYQKQIAIQNDEITKMKKRFRAQKITIIGVAGAIVGTVIAVAL